MNNPAFWTAIPESDSDGNEDDEDWSLPPPDPVKEAEIRAALEAANALKHAKQQEEMKYESAEDRRKREREERRKLLLLQMQQTDATETSENAAPSESSNTLSDEAPVVPKKKPLPGFPPSARASNAPLTLCLSLAAERPRRARVRSCRP
jgi:hypothetical protein